MARRRLDKEFHGWDSEPFGAVPDEVIEQAAQVVASQLMRLAEGNLDDPQTWLGLGKEMGIIFVPTDCAGPGSYLSPDQVRRERWPLPSGWAVIQYDGALTGRDLSEVLVHELAHDRLHHWQPPQLPRAADIQRYDDDPQDVHHRVARRSQRILLG